MILDKVTLHRFRNYDSLQHSFSEGLNLFVGQNGEGKTNLLESIYYLSHFNSFRTHRLEVLSKDRHKTFSIQLRFNEPQSMNLSVVHQNAQTSIELNRKSVTQSEVQGLLKVVLFTVRDLDLILLAPSVRRDFFDQILSLMKKEYLELLKNYTKLVRLRNQQLKRGRLNQEWDQLIIPYGTKIIYARNSFLQAITPLFQKIFARFTHSSIPANIAYRLTHQNDQNSPMNEVLYQRALDQCRRTDEQKGFTHFGPHTDDYLFQMRHQLCKDNSSQGEMRVFVYALKLAIYEYFKKVIKQTPILLLDDVFNDFDEERITKFFQYLGNQKQVIITAANPNLIIPYVSKSVLKKSLFRIHQGKVSKFTP